MRHGAGRAGAGCNLCFALFLPSLSWIFHGIARARKKARFARGDVVGLCAMTNSRETMRLLPSEGNTDDRIMRMLLGGRRGPKSGDTSNMKMNAIESQLFPLAFFAYARTLIPPHLRSLGNDHTGNWTTLLSLCLAL